MFNLSLGSTLVSQIAVGCGISVVVRIFIRNPGTSSGILINGFSVANFLMFNINLLQVQPREPPAAPVSAPSAQVEHRPAVLGHGGQCQQSSRQ